MTFGPPAASRDRPRLTRAQMQRAVGAHKIDPVRIVLGGHRQDGNYRVRTGRLEQLDTSVDVRRLAKRVGRLQEADGIESVASLLQTCHGTSYDGQRGSVVFCQLRRPHEGHLQAARPAHLGDLWIVRRQHDARKSGRAVPTSCFRSGVLTARKPGSLSISRCKAGGRTISASACSCVGLA